MAELGSAAARKTAAPPVTCQAAAWVTSGDDERDAGVLACWLGDGHAGPHFDRPDGIWWAREEPQQHEGRHGHG